ncbi:hypothetical protein GS504_00840 [Rhodococcus hoagii]|nr:hypothetical protein [Prescottella equi]
MSEFTHVTAALGEAAYIDAKDENSVPDGLYWRVTPGCAADLPAGPVLLRPLQMDDVPVSALDTATGQAVQDGRQVTPDSPVLLLPQTPDGGIVCWAHVQAEGQLRVAAISARTAISGAYVELSARTQDPYDVAGHDMAGLIITGDGAIIEAVFYALQQSFAGDIGDIEGELQVHAMPDDLVPGHGYAIPGATAQWRDRVALAGPRTSVPYALHEPGGPWTPDEELARAEVIARADHSVAEWLADVYDALGSGTRATIVGAAGTAGDTNRVIVSQAASSALATASLDPGIARWLGRSGMLRHGLVQAEWHGLLVATVPLHVYANRLPHGVSVVRGGDDWIYDDRIHANGAFLKLLEEVQGWVPHPKFGAHDVVLAHIPLPYVVATTPARPVQPVLGPAPAHAGMPGGAGPRWAADPPRRWEQTIAIGGRPRSARTIHGPIPRGPVAFIRTDPQPETTLHTEIAGTDLAAPVLPGWDSATCVSTVHGTELVPDGAAADPVRWSIALSDWIGRWGDRRKTPPLVPPAWIVPATPTIDAALVRPAIPLGTDATSPGQVHVRFRIPPTTIPGALPLRELAWMVDGLPQPQLDLTQAVTDPGSAALLVSAVFPARATVPGESRTTRVTAQVVDTAGTASDSAAADVETSDARPLQPPSVAPRLLVTSRRAGDANVSVTLTVRTPASGAYRFYLASEAALRTAASIKPSSAATRAIRAQELNERTAATARQASMLALPEPVSVNGGVATACLEIPAGTVDVLAIRAVPVTAEVNKDGRVIRDGVEPPFDSVDPVFVVVPFDEVPPTPDLHLTPAGEPGPNSTTVTATVTVRGVQAAVLDRYAEEPLQARLVEASTSGDPWFWPQIATTQLSQSPTDAGAFTGEVSIAVPAWSRAGIAVAVRYPPEDTIVPGVNIIDEPELDATGLQGTRIESPWGPVSVPAWIQVEGAQPQIATKPDDAGGFTIHVTGLPALSSNAPTFRVDLYGAAAGSAGALVPLSGSAVTAGASMVTVGSDIATAHPRLAVVLVTPFGTSLPPVEVGP